MHDYSSDKENYSLRVPSSVNVEIERSSFALMGRPNDERLAEVKMFISWINCLFMVDGCWWYRREMGCGWVSQFFLQLKVG